MNLKKVETIKSWLKLTNVKEVRRFFKLTNFYRRFIKKYRRLAIPFIELTKKDKVFEWREWQQVVFKEFKNRIVYRLIL